MSELDELYQDVILDHNRTPRNFRRIAPASASAKGYNPLCGDQFTVYLTIENDTVKDVSFEGAGCAISKASASLMTEAVKGKTRAEVAELFGKFHAMVTSDFEKEINTASLGKLAVLGGVRQFPIRVKCASLAWHALHAALEGKQEPVSTE
ncbi:MAG: SUF system NifU family Fe-S cluster assembly protein [Planctomycetota bacterium]